MEKHTILIGLAVALVLLIVFFTDRFRLKSASICFILLIIDGCFLARMYGQATFKETVSASEFIEHKGHLYYKGEEVVLEKNIPPLFLLKCRRRVVVTRELDHYIIYINDNI